MAVFGTGRFDWSKWHYPTLEAVEGQPMVLEVCYSSEDLDRDAERWGIGRPYQADVQTYLAPPFFYYPEQIEADFATRLHYLLLRLEVAGVRERDPRLRAWWFATDSKNRLVGVVATPILSDRVEPTSSTEIGRTLADGG